MPFGAASAEEPFTGCSCPFVPPIDRCLIDQEPAAVVGLVAFGHSAAAVRHRLPTGISFICHLLKEM
jgi:hypothetical protein